MNPITLPNFLIIGAAKAGTTSIYNYLNQHPQIYMSPLKEPNFFALEGQKFDFRGPGDREYIERFSVTDRERYSELFQGVSREVAVGEASALYLYSAEAPSRIRYYAPRMKLITILRHPVDRAYSAFLHLRRDRREPLCSFAHALAAEDVRIRNNWEHIWHYRRMGFYASQLERYYRHFSRDQIRVYLYDALQREPLNVLADMFGFLCVDATFTPDTSVRHNQPVLPTEKRPPLHSDVRQQLLQSYRADILRLQEMVGADLRSWLV